MINKNFIILDFETTRNFSKKEEEVIEIAALKIDQSFNILEEFHYLVKPSCPITNITKIKTGLTENQLYNKPRINEVFPLLIKFIENNNLIAHNAKFDYKVFIECCKKLNYKYSKINFIDSLSIMKNLFPDEKCSLNSLKMKFDILKNSHRSLEDVHSLREILILSNKDYINKFNKTILEDLDKFKVSLNENKEKQTILNF